jgi:heat shock protein HtpX
MMIAFGFALLMNGGAYWFSDRIALRMAGAREVTPDEAPELHQLVAGLARRADLPVPRVAIIDSDSPNAFATGRNPRHGVVAVTLGLLRMLDRDELAGVIAHELAHIKHRDTLVSAVAATAAGAITMLAHMAQWALLFGGLGDEGEDDGGLAGLVGSLFMIVLAPIAATLIQLAISRAREFGADAAGARIAGDPIPLASALRKLEGGVARRPLAAAPATAHLYIVNPLRGGAVAGLFRTHPSTSDRIARLEQLALGRRGAA